MSDDASAAFVSQLDAAIAPDELVSALQSVTAAMTAATPAAHERVVYRSAAAAFGRVAAHGGPASWEVYTKALDALRAAAFEGPPAVTRWDGRAFLCKALATQALPPPPAPSASPMPAEAFLALFRCLAAVAAASESAERTANEIRIGQDALRTVCNGCSVDVVAPALANAALAADVVASPLLSAITMTRLQELADSSDVAKACVEKVEVDGIAPRLFGRSADAADVATMLASLTRAGVMSKEKEAAIIAGCVNGLRRAAAAAAAAADTSAGPIEAASYATRALGILINTRPVSMRSLAADPAILASCADLIDAATGIWNALVAASPAAQNDEDDSANAAASPSALADAHTATSLALLHSVRQFLLIAPRHATLRNAPSTEAAAAAAVTAEAEAASEATELAAPFRKAVTEFARAVCAHALPRAPASDASGEASVAAATDGDAPADAAAASESGGDVASAAAAAPVASASPSSAAAAELPAHLVGWARALDPIMLEVALDVTVVACLVTNVAPAVATDATWAAATEVLVRPAAALQAHIAAMGGGINTNGGGAAPRSHGNHHGHRGGGGVRRGRDNQQRGGGAPLTAAQQAGVDTATLRLAVIASAAGRVAALRFMAQEGAPAYRAPRGLANPSWIR